MLESAAEVHLAVSTKPGTGVSSTQGCSAAHWVNRPPTSMVQNPFGQLGRGFLAEVQRPTEKTLIAHHFRRSQSRLQTRLRG